MFEELYVPIPDGGAYLARIGLADLQIAHTEDCLTTIVRSQLTHIPFDDLDVYATGACPSLAIDALFEKIVTRRRGGYCYELNSLFCSLLNALGFPSYMISVGVVRVPGQMPVPSHCAVITTIDGVRYFSDVGFGGPVPFGCVRMDGQEHLGYRVIDHEEFKVLATAAGDPVMMFRDIPALPVELVPLNFHISQKKDSLFRNTLLLNLRLDGGSVSVTGRHFRYSCGDVAEEYELKSVEELRWILPKYFGIPCENVTLREYTI